MPLKRFACVCAALLAAAALPWVWTGCAHMEPPPGGPADSTRPFLIAVYPAPGAVNAPRELKARLGFSEWINPDAEKGKVYLSPTPSRLLKTKLSGDVLEVTCASPLDENTTYALGVSGNIKDLNGWPLESPYQLIFSTGPILDSSKLAGRLAVFPGARPPAGTFAALYPQGKELRARFSHLPRDSAGRVDSFPDPARERPAYISAADSLGRFAFVGARPGQYLLLGFQDNNGNLVPNLGSENLAIGPSVAAPGPRPLGLALAPYDTVPAKLMEARWVGEQVRDGKSQGTVRLKFSRALHPVQSLRPEAYSVRPKGGGAPLPVIGVDLNPVSGEIELQTPPLPVDSSFIAACPGVRDMRGNPVDTSRKEAPFKVDAKLDTTSAMPVILGQLRISGQRDKLVTDHFVPARGLTAYYPRLLTDSTLADLRRRLEAKLDTAHPAVLVTRTAPHEFSLRFPSAPAKGKYMQISLRLPDTAHAAASATTPAAPGQAVPAPTAPAIPAPTAPPGQNPAPSVPAKPDSAARAHMAPRPPPSASLAALTLEDSAKLGSLTFRQEASARGARLVLRSLATGLEYTRVTPQSADVKMDSLPEGWYVADIFRDADADGFWSAGRLKPWTPQEPFAHWADSVEVKAGAVSDAAATARPAVTGDLSLP